MNRFYKTMSIFLLCAGLVLGGGGFLLKYAVFQGVMASGESRTNKECLTDERVFDKAGVLSDEEEMALRELIAKKESIIGADIVLLTIREPSIDDFYMIRDYAQAFYEENGFGWDKANGDGVIYVDNWATGYCWMCTTGEVKEVLDDSTAQYIVDRTNEKVNRNAAGAYRTMVQLIAEEMQNLHLFHFHVKSYWLALAALMFTAGFVIVNWVKNKGEVTTTKSTYVPEGGIVVHRRENIYLRSYVTRHKIEKNHSSGGGGGSVGGSGGHGGAGGRH
ncbi:MAG: TPM domain-containing protein [Eubacteriales bacterium]|nr:TPM domain-containing protein [Eubacteriales bacterium]